MNTPKLRFDGFEEDWELKKIIDIAPLQRGFDLVKNDIIPGKYPIGYSNGILGYHNEFKAKGPGVFTGRSGTIGNIHYTESDYWPHNTSLWVTDFKGNNQKFIYYFYKRVDLKKYNAGSTVPTLNRNDVHDLKKALPSNEEQEKIALFFTLLDKKIEKQQRKTEKLEHFKKGMMQKVFSQEIRFKHEDGEEFGEWKKNVQASNLFKNISDKDHLGDLPVLSASQEKGIVMRNSNNIKIQFSLENLVNYKRVEPNDFVISLRSFQGGIEFSKLLGIMSPAYTIFKSLDTLKIYSPYFSFLFKTKDFISKLNNLTYGIRDGKAISFTDFSSMKFNLPTYNEQKKISIFLSIVDKKIEKEKERLLVMEEQKKGFMQRMFV